VASFSFVTAEVVRVVLPAGTLGELTTLFPAGFSV